MTACVCNFTVNHLTISCIIFQVTVMQENPLECTLSKTLAPVGLALCEGNWFKLAQTVIASKDLCRLVTEALLKKVKAECKVLCSTLSKTKLRLSSPEDLTKFDWKDVAFELQQKAPTFLSFLTKVAAPSHLRNRHKGATEDSLYPADLGSITQKSNILLLVN